MKRNFFFKMFNMSIKISFLFILFFFHYRLMLKKCMAASISGLFQGGMKIFGGNPGLILRSVSAKIFLQPWKVILEWILSLSVQKWIRPYQEGLVFFLLLMCYGLQASWHSKAHRRKAKLQGVSAESWQSSLLFSFFPLIHNS